MGIPPNVLVNKTMSLKYKPTDLIEIRLQVKLIRLGT